MDRKYITEEYVRNILKKRKPDTHKGDYGRVLIVAGSKPMTGAAILTARGALRAGSGLIYLCVPEELFPIFQIAVPEAICVERGSISEYASYDSIIFGPGLGMKRDETRFHADLLTTILESYRGPLLIDADGLNLVSKYGMQEMLSQTEADVILTPHMGEATRLLPELPQDRLSVSEALHEATGAIAVIKGTGTVVRGNNIFINTTGNPGMATAGSGDVLSGIIGSLAGQGYAAEEAAQTGVFLHGLAGDLAADRLGQWGIIASDIADYTSAAIQKTIGE